jgi:2-hydroxychromene-2-carboxylate isomerase
VLERSLSLSKDRAMGQPLLIDLVADVVCPWCYLGWRRVKSAVALRPDVEPLIVWRPYQLDPTLPEQGVDRKAYMAGKFKDALKLKAVHTALVEAGAEEGIVFDFDAIELSPNTSAAHRLIRWAHGAGKQDAVVEGLFAAYFTQGRDIGDPVVLSRDRRGGGHGSGGDPAPAVGGRGQGHHRPRARHGRPGRDHRRAVRDLRRQAGGARSLALTRKPAELDGKGAKRPGLARNSLK